jgi:hypothetical protein
VHLLALQVAPVSYYCLNIFIGPRPKLGNTYYHIKVAIKEYRIWANVFGTGPGLLFFLSFFHIFLIPVYVGLVLTYHPFLVIISN